MYRTLQYVKKSIHYNRGRLDAHKPVDLNSNPEKVPAHTVFNSSSTPRDFCNIIAVPEYIKATIPHICAQEAERLAMKFNILSTKVEWII